MGLRGRVAGMVLLAGMGWQTSLHAGTLYRCDAPDGSRSYSSKRVPGASCSVVGSYNAAASRSARWQPVAPAAAASIQPMPVNAGPVPAPATEAVPTITAPSAPAPLTHGSRRVSGRVYTYKRNGVTYATSVAPRGVPASAMRTIAYSYIETCFACGAKPGVNFGTLRLNTSAYRDEIAAASRTHGVDESILRAIMHAESAYNPRALSRVGAQGLMQLMPATARRFGVTNAFDPGQNIQGGAQYLAWLLRRFNGDLTLAAAGYNAGEGAVDKYKGVPPYSETRRYVERVRTLAERYRGEIARAN